MVHVSPCPRRLWSSSSRLASRFVSSPNLISLITASAIFLTSSLSTSYKPSSPSLHPRFADHRLGCKVVFLRNGSPFHASSFWTISGAASKCLLQESTRTTVCLSVCMRWFERAVVINPILVSRWLFIFIFIFSILFFVVTLDILVLSPLDLFYPLSAFTAIALTTPISKWKQKTTRRFSH